MTEPLVSVVIATRNRAALLAQTLDALAGQRLPREAFDIVVADNCSTDDTRAVVAAFAHGGGAPPVHYLYVAEPGKSCAVNSALAHARGVLVAFTDDDVLPSPEWLPALARAFDDLGIDFAAGRILPRWEVPPPAWMSPALYGVLAIPDNGNSARPIDESHDGIMPIGANMAVRRRVIERIGGLRADLGKLEGTLRTGEDHEFFLRMLHAGCRGLYVPDAVVQHWVPHDRLRRAYFRRWLHQNGQDVSKLEAAYTPRVRRLFGVPRHLWRQFAKDLVRAARATALGDGPARFAASLRLIWFAGYVREAWRRGGPHAIALPLAAHR
jgi:glycosyltransferase involved in cell wall biosynthesis